MALADLKAVAQLMSQRRRCFDVAHFDQERFERIMALPAPDNIYGIFFTPRSGSTRVTELMAQAGLSNAPREYFNETAMPQFARNHGARSLEEYVALISRKQQVGGHFGFEATYKHIRFAFRSPARFEQLLRPDRAAWLIREDIVAQAVSVSRLLQTQVSHTSRSSADAQADAEQRFTYRPRQIMDAMKRLTWLEARSEVMFAKLGLEPFRLSYEAINAMGAQQSVTVLADALGLGRPEVDITDSHHKLAGDKSAEFAERFRVTRAMDVAKCDRARAALLQKLYAQRDGI